MPTNSGYNSSDSLELLNSIRESVAILFSRANSILTGREVPVVFDGGYYNNNSSSTAPAWTDGETIYIAERSFNSTYILTELWDGPNKSIPSSARTRAGLIQSLISLRGLNYHELSHVLYTPRIRGAVADAITNIVFNRAHTSHDGFKMFNILEDQRIESLFTTKYPASKPYFTRTVSQFLLDPNQSDLDTVFLLVYGRKYLPADIRSIAEQNFQQKYKVTDSDIAQFKRLIDAYRALSLPAQLSLAIGIITEFGNLLLKYLPSFFDSTSGNTAGGHAKTNKGSNESNREQGKIAKSEEFDEENDDTSSDNGAGGQDSDEESDDEPSDEESGESSDDEEGDESDGSDDESETSGSVSKSGDSSNRESDVEHNKSDNKKILDAARNVVQQIDEQLTDDIRKQIKNIREVAQKQRFKRFFESTIAPYETVAPSAHFKALSNSISSALAKLIADNDNQWDRSTNSGNLNVLSQKLSRGLHTDIFDQWVDEGNDDVSAEVVVLLDLSGSMDSYPIDWDKANRILAEEPATLASFVLNRALQLDTSLVKEASQAMWSLKSACQAQGIPCSVIGYSDRPFALFSANDTVTRQAGIFGAHGNTVASGALAVAESVFTNSEAKYKLLVTITDGEIQDRHETEAIVSRLNSAGVQTVLIGLASHHYDGETFVKERKFKPVYSVKKEQQKKGDKPLPYSPSFQFQDVLGVPDCKALVKVIGKTLIKGVVAKI